MTPHKAQRIWTKDEESYLEQHFNMAGAIQCARILKRQVRSVSSKAQGMGLTKIDRPLTLEILNLAARPMKGCRTVDLSDKSSNGSREFLRLIKQKRIFKCVISYRDVRYFTTEKLAHAMRVSRELVITKSTHRGVTINDNRKGKGWGPNDPMHGYETAPITYGPSPTSCYRTNTHLDSDM